MRNETTVSKWGNSLAVRIPQRLAKQARINEGDLFDLAYASVTAALSCAPRVRGTSCQSSYQKLLLKTGMAKWIGALR